MDLGNSHIYIEGRFVSAKHERIVRSIKEYDNDLNVEFCPPEHRENGQAAFRIIYQPEGQRPYTLFCVGKDEDFDERVLMRIIANDNRVNGGKTLSDLEAFENAQMLLKKQDFQDKMDEANDIAGHVIKSPLNKYTVNKNLIFKDGIPFNAARL